MIKKLKKVFCPFLLIITLTALAFTPGCGKNSPSGTAGVAKNLGKAEARIPESKSVIMSKSFGEVPANQVLVVLKEGSSKKDAEKVITDLDGTLVGEIELIGMYQIELKTSTEDGLISALKKAESNGSVEMALPNSALHLSAIKGKKCSPINDPVYSEGNNSRHYDMIGLENAWDIIKASGIKLNKTHVGVTDEALYTKSEEINGKAKISGLSTGDSTDQPALDKDGKIDSGGLTHGTMVTHVIGADSENGGPVGIASVLEDNLEITVNNTFNGKSEVEHATWDEDDPTKQLDYDGRAYVVNVLADLQKQVDNGATIINCSFNYDMRQLTTSSDKRYMEWLSKAYTRFLNKVQEKHPDVLFVASAGNYNQELSGKNDIWGLKAPNLITVGALDGEGKKAKFSNYASGDAEITLSAPGVDMALGVDENGKTVTASGTSFSAPQVTAAAALIRSINPKLTADEIKKLLVDTCAPGVTNGDTSIPIPEGMGAGVLKVDDAVLKAVNDVRAENNLPPITKESMIALRSVDLSAEGGPEEYKVTASIKEIGSKPAPLKIELLGQGAIGGSTEKTLSAPGEVTWSVTTTDKSANVRVKRLDTGGCAFIVLTVPDPSGLWDGKMTVTKDTLSPLIGEMIDGMVAEMGCETSGTSDGNTKDNVGAEISFSMNIKKVEGSENSYTLNINANDDEEDEDDEPTTLQGYFKAGSLVFEQSEEGGSVVISLAVEDENNMKGTLSIIFKDNSGTGEISGDLTAVRISGN